MLLADIIRFTREDKKYKFMFVEYVTCTIYGFNQCVKVEQTAVINIVKDMTDFTVEGWKIGKEIPTWVLGYDEWVNDNDVSPFTPGTTRLIETKSQSMMRILRW